jgi:hypothetical protein
MRFARWHGKTFIGSEDNNLMPTGGTGSNEVRRLVDPSSSFGTTTGYPQCAIYNVDIYMISGRISYTFGLAKIRVNFWQTNRK